MDMTRQESKNKNLNRFVLTDIIRHESKIQIFAF